MGATAVKDLVAWLQGFEERIPIDELKARLIETPIAIDDVADKVQFGERTYQRNLLAHGRQFYAIVMCWKPGQSSPVHDHRGASCGVRVLQGVATETTYRWENEKLVVDSVQERPQGGVCGSFDADVHDISNNGDVGLVTLHIYSPYLTNVNIYDLESGEVTVFTDPLVEEMLKA